MCIKDHKGNKFASHGEMCEFYGIPLNLFRQRLRKGWSLRKALETPLMRFTDHEGNNFKSSAEMCKVWCIPHDVFKSRLRDGWTLKDALETPVSLGRRQVKDHKGNMFKSIKEMCKAYDIDYYTFNSRVRVGWALKEALETPVNATLDKWKVVTDHKGNKFRSIKEMCKAYGIDYPTFKARRHMGWTLKDVLEGKSVTDYKGNKFRSTKEMCKAYGVNYRTFSHRLKLGWTLKDALETPVGVPLEAYWVTDHKGNKFKTNKEMCKAYGVVFNTFKGRISRGWTLKDALETPAKRFKI